METKLPASYSFFIVFSFCVLCQLPIHYSVTGQTKSDTLCVSFADTIYSEEIFANVNYNNCSAVKFYHPDNIVHLTKPVKLNSVTLFAEHISASLESVNLSPSFAGFIFENSVEIYGTRQQRLQFTQTKFENGLYFATDSIGVLRFEAEFPDDALFTENIIGEGIFTRSSVYAQLNFANTVFNKKLLLNELLLGNNALFNFSGVLLPDTIDLSENSKIPKEIDLSIANFTHPSRYDSAKGSYAAGRKHYINLYKSDISQFHLDYSHFKLLLQDPLTGKELPKDEGKSVYETLLNNFKLRGQQDSYKMLDIEYQEYLDESWNKWKSKLNQWWWNFGYDKGKIFIHALTFLVLFTLINFFFLNILNGRENGVYHVEHIPYEIPLSQPLRRLWYSLMYTGCVFFLFSLKIENLRYRRGAIIYILTIYTIGIVCIAYMANFVLQK